MFVPSLSWQNDRCNTYMAQKCRFVRHFRRFKHEYFFAKPGSGQTEARKIFHIESGGVLCRGSGISGPNTFSGTVLFPPQFEPSPFLPVVAAKPRSSLRWEALLDGLYDLERAALLSRWVALATALPHSAEREAALAAGHAALRGVAEVVWVRPVRNDLTAQPFSTAAAVWEEHKEGVERALEGLAAVM